MRGYVYLGAGVAIVTGLSGCALVPRDTQAEQARLNQAAQPYEAPFDERNLPEVPARPDWRDILHRAFLANGELEAAYFEWKAALWRVQITGAYPNSNLAFAYEYMFSKEKMKAWDRSTLTLGFDPSMSVSLPFKVIQAAKIALNDAQASGKRFETAKFALQQKVLTAWFDLALAAEKARIQTENINLLKMISEIAAQRVRTGAPQQDLLKAQTEYEMGVNELADMRIEQASIVAMLNGMMARRPDAALDAPGELPQPRPLAADDSQLIALAIEGNPEVAALAQEVKSKGGTVDLAKLGYLPDFSASISVRGSIEQNLGAMIMWPANLGRVNAEIEEARAMLKRTEAMARQTRSDRWSQFAATLYAMRNNERQIGLFRDSILPKAQQAWGNSIKAYSAGTIGFSDLIDAQRLLLQVRLLIAEARMGREKRLAELEALGGTDVETLAEGTATPASQPASGPMLVGREIPADGNATAPADVQKNGEAPATSPAPAEKVD